MAVEYLVLQADAEEGPFARVRAARPLIDCLPTVNGLFPAREG
jgi:hypothetical protein